MRLQEEKTIQCPYCLESITVLVDASVCEQEYVEDCQVCCQPILLQVYCGDESVSIRVDRENA